MGRASDPPGFPLPPAPSWRFPVDDGSREDRNSHICAGQRQLLGSKNKAGGSRVCLRVHLPGPPARCPCSHPGFVVGSGFAMGDDSPRDDPNVKRIAKRVAAEVQKRKGLRYVDV